MLERQRPSPTPSQETEAGGWLPPPPLVGGGAGVPGHHQGQAGCLDSLEAGHAAGGPQGQAERHRPHTLCPRAGTVGHLVCTPPPLTKVCKCHPHSGSLACEVPTSSEHPPSPAPRPHPSLQRARGSGEGGTWPRATAGHRRSWEGSQVGSQASALSASWRQGSGSECGHSTRWLPLSEGGRPRGQGHVCSRLFVGKDVSSEISYVTLDQASMGREVPRFGQ